MTEPGRVFAHAQQAGCATVLEYAVELEDILEQIVAANRIGPYVDPDDMHAALYRARDLVDSWGQP